MRQIITTVTTLLELLGAFAIAAAAGFAAADSLTYAAGFAAAGVTLVGESALMVAIGDR